MDEPAATAPPRPAGVSLRATIEIALIAVVLVFAWSRPSGPGDNWVRLRAYANRVADRFVLGGPIEACDGVIATLATEYRQLGPRSPHPLFPKGRRILASGSYPLMVQGLARALIKPVQPPPGRALYFFELFLVPDEAGRLASVRIWTPGMTEAPWEKGGKVLRTLRTRPPGD